MTVSQHQRYGNMLAAALLLVIVGVYLGEQWVIALAAVPFTFLVFGALSSVPDPELRVERTIEPKRPIPGDDVTVTLTVENVGTTPIPDLRVADGVPSSLGVIDGHPSVSAALAPGQTETTRYTVRASRNRHVFDQPRARVRSIAADSYRELDVPVEGDTECTAQVFLDNPPTVRETSTLVGGVTADTGGSGVEFHTVRQYRPGDPINRIDWRRLARDGELSTIDFREYGGLSVFVIADCRPWADVSPTPQLSSGLELTQYAADRIVHALEREGHETGFTALGADIVPFITPGSSKLHVQTRTALRALDDEVAWNGPQLHIDEITDGTTLSQRLVEQFQPGTQVVFITPLGDDLPVAVVKQLRAHGYQISMVVPGVSDGDDVGEQLVDVKRQARITRLRDAGISVIEWTRTDPLPVALSTHAGGERV